MYVFKGDIAVAYRFLRVDLEGFEGGFRGFRMTYRFLRVDLEIFVWPIVWIY